MYKLDCVVLDTDDVLLNYTVAFRDFIRKHYNIVPKYPYPTEKGYAEWLNRTPKEIDMLIMHFNERSWEFGTIRNISGARRAVNFLEQRNIQLVVVTKCGTAGHATVLRNANLVNVFGDVFSEITILEYHESKMNTLKRLSEKYNVLAVLDDNVQNIEDALELNLRGVLFKSSQNEVFMNQYETVSDWDEALHLFMQMPEIPKSAA